MEQVIAKIRKSRTNEVWVVIAEFKGQLRIDVREHFHAGEDGSLPTKKGVSLPVSTVAALRDAADKLALADAEGTVATFAVGDRAEIRAGIRKFQGNTYAEMRVYIPSSANEGEWKPTYKGFTLKPALVQQLADAIGEAEDFLDSME